VIFGMLDTFRAGRWYGSKGNGNVVGKCLDFIEEVKRWAKIRYLKNSNFH
jgi:hypothetical protein